MKQAVTSSFLGLWETVLQGYINCFPFKETFSSFFFLLFNFIKLSIVQETACKHSRISKHEMIVFIYCISLQFDSASSLT